MPPSPLTSRAPQPTLRQPQDPTEEAIASSRAAHTADMAPEVGQATDAAVYYLFGLYCQSGSQASSRVSAPNTNPKMTLSQFLRLCQDVGLAAPQGAMDPSLLQTVHSSYKPLGSSALTYPHFLQALEAIARSLHKPLEDLTSLLADHAHKRLADMPQPTSPTRQTRSADERQRRLFSAYAALPAGKGSISARSASSYAGGVAEPQLSQSQSQQRFANVARLWKPSMAAVEEKNGGARVGARYSAPAGRVVTGPVSSPLVSVSVMQEAWTEQGIGGFVSVGRPGSALAPQTQPASRADLSSRESNVTIPTHDSDSVYGGGLAMPSWALTLLERVQMLEKQAQAGGSASTAAQSQQQQQQQQPLQSWGSRHSSSNHLLEDTDPSDLSLMSAAEKAETKAGASLPRPPLPPVRVKSADRLGGAATVGASVAGGSDVLQRLAALESAAGAASLSLAQLQRQVQEQGEQLAQLLPGPSVTTSAGGISIAEGDDKVPAHLEEMQSALQALFVSAAEHKQWQEQQQHLAATVATLSATVAAQQRTLQQSPGHLTLSVTRDAPSAPSSPTIDTMRKVSDASGHSGAMSEEAMAHLVGVAGDLKALNQRVTAVEGTAAVAVAQAGANAAARGSRPSSLSESVDGAPSPTGSIFADRTETRELMARLQAVEHELEALQQRHQESSQDSMAVVAASSAAATATSTASQTAVETSRLEKRVRALEEHVSQVEGRVLQGDAPASSSTTAAPATNSFTAAASEAQHEQAIATLQHDLCALQQQLAQLEERAPLNQEQQQAPADSATAQHMQAQRLSVLELQLQELGAQVQGLHHQLAVAAPGSQPTLGEEQVTAQLQHLQELASRPSAIEQQQAQASTFPAPASAAELHQLQELASRVLGLEQQQAEPHAAVAVVPETAARSSPQQLHRKQEPAADADAALQAQVRQLTEGLQALQGREYVPLERVQQLEQRLTLVSDVAETASAAAASLSLRVPQQPIAAVDEPLTKHQAAYIQEDLAAAQEQLHAMAERLGAVEVYQANQIQDQQAGVGAGQETHVQLAEVWTRLDALHQQQLALAAVVDLPKMEQQVAALSERVQQELEEAARQRMEMTEVLSQHHLSRRPSQALTVEPSDGSFPPRLPSDGSIMMNHTVRPEMLTALERRVDELVAQVEVLQQQHGVTAQFEQGLGELAGRLLTMEEQQVETQLKKVAEVEQLVKDLAADVEGLKQQQLLLAKDATLAPAPEAVAAAASAAAPQASRSSSTADNATVALLQHQVQQLAVQLQAVEALRPQVEALEQATGRVSLPDIQRTVTELSAAMQSSDQQQALAAQQLDQRIQAVEQAQAQAQADLGPRASSSDESRKALVRIDAAETQVQALHQGQEQMNKHLQGLELKLQQQGEASTTAAAAPVTLAMAPGRDQAALIADVTALSQQLQLLQQAQHDAEAAAVMKLQQVHDALLKEVQQVQAQQKKQEQAVQHQLQQVMVSHEQVKQAPTGSEHSVELGSLAAELQKLQEVQSAQANSASEAVALAQGLAQQLQAMQTDIGVMAQQAQGQMEMQQALMNMMQQQQLQLQALQAAAASSGAAPADGPATTSLPAAGSGASDANQNVDELRNKMKAFQASQKAAVKMLVMEFQKLQDQVKEIAAAGSGAAVPGAAGVDPGVASLMERMVALEQRIQSGQAEQGAGSGAELARALGLLSIETQKSLAWLKEELQDVRDVASRAASAAPSRAISRANSAAQSRALSRSSSAASLRSPRAGVSFAEDSAGRGAVLSAAAAAALASTSSTVPRSFSAQHRDSLPQGPPLVEPSDASRIGSGGAPDASNPDELKRALGLLSLETQRQLEELRAEVKGMSSRAASAAPSRAASRPMSAMSRWDDPADEEDLMAGPTPMLTPMAGPGQPNVFAATPQATAPGQVPYTPVALPGAPAAPHATQVVAAAAQLQAMQVKQLNDRLQQMESALPPQNTLGELVAKVEDMAQALMMVADKLNKRVVKLEKTLGKGSVAGGIAPAIMVLQEEAAAAEAELKGYLDMAASSMEQRVDAMYMTLGLMPPPPGARPWNEARPKRSPRQAPQADADEETALSSKADLSAVPSRTAMRGGSKAAADQEGATEAEQATPTGRGGRRVVINQAASEVRTIPVVRKASFAQLAPPQDEAGQQWEEQPQVPQVEAAAALPSAAAVQPLPSVPPVQTRRAPLTSLVQMPTPPSAGLSPQAQQMQQLQQMYMQALTAMQQQQQQQQQAAMPGPAPSFDPVGGMAAAQPWAPPAATDPAAAMALMMQMSPGMASALQPQRLSYGGTVTPIPGMSTPPMMPYGAEGTASEGVSPLPTSAALQSESSRSQWDELTSAISQQIMAGAASQQAAAAVASLQRQASNTVAKRPSLKQRLSASGKQRLSGSGGAADQARPGTGTSPTPPASAPQVLLTPGSTEIGSSRSRRFATEDVPSRTSATSTMAPIGAATMMLPHQPDRAVSVSMQLRRPAGSDAGGKAEEPSVLGRAQSQTLEHEGAHMEFEVAEESYF